MSPGVEIWNMCLGRRPDYDPITNITGTHMVRHGPNLPSQVKRQPLVEMASGPHDIVSSADGSAVRYKVYNEKNRKSKIKLWPVRLLRPQRSKA